METSSWWLGEWVHESQLHEICLVLMGYINFVPIKQQLSFTFVSKTYWSETKYNDVNKFQSRFINNTPINKILRVKVKDALN